jgi:hypothetical protein
MKHKHQFYMDKYDESNIFYTKKYSLAKNTFFDVVRKLIGGIGFVNVVGRIPISKFSPPQHLFSSTPFHFVGNVVSPCSIVLDLLILF